ncbi:MAG: DUF2240 family protein [Candidatus Thalassarchaeaceae archaeon]|nr:DUF2240 family protein [Candidatus Thalassarchaeaceae archaeon]
MARLKHRAPALRWRGIAMSERRPDVIARLLHSSFHGASDLGVSRPDLARMWSLELQWFSPDDSLAVVDRLHESGWLVGDEGSLKPNPHIELLPPELGWQPFSGSFAAIPSFAHPSSRASSEPALPEPRAPQNNVLEPPAARLHRPPDRAEDSVQALIAHVARKSGLDRREVVRRAQRKRRALGPVTLWMAIALLAREQSLDMHEVLEIIESRSSAVAAGPDLGCEQSWEDQQGEHEGEGHRD